MPEIAYGNNAFIFETQKEKKLTSADKALLVVTLMGFALGDKKANQNISLTNGYKKKPTKKPGACLGSQGYLHSFILGLNVHETLWLNLFSKEQLNELAYWLNGLGIAPWERMPDGEDCEIARDLKESYLGRLVPLSRFCFLAEEGLHYSEGIIFSDHKEGGIDPSIGLSFQKKEREAVWVNPEKRPWRMIIAFLSYLQKSSNQSFDCLFISKGMSRAKLLSDFGIWSGGLRVSSKSGHQFFSGNDDFVESKIRLSQEVIGNSDLFWRIEDQIKFLDKISKSISTAVSDYYKQLKVNGAKHAQLAVNLFWQGCEKYAQELFQLDHSKKLRNKFEKLAFDVYDQVCHKGTSRQINSWAYNREKIKVSSK